MMNLRKRIIVLVSLLVGILLVLVLGLLVFAPTEEPSDIVTPLDQTIPSAAVPVPGSSLSAPVAAPTGQVPAAVNNPGEVYVEQLATLFVERFGTYSNQNENVNINDAVALATPDMIRWLETKRHSGDSLDHTGVTVRAISSQVDSYTDAAAEVTVDTIQDRTSASSADERSYRTARVELLYQAGEWKVDGMYWEAE